MVFHYRRRILTLRHQPLATRRTALAGDTTLRDCGRLSRAGLSDVAIQRYELVPVLFLQDMDRLINSWPHRRRLDWSGHGGNTDETSRSQHCHWPLPDKLNLRARGTCRNPGARYDIAPRRRLDRRRRRSVA